jgi:hypothetical protein
VFNARQEKRCNYRRGTRPVRIITAIRKADKAVRDLPEQLFEIR